MNQNSMMYGDSKFSIVSNSIKSDPFTFFDLDTLTNMEKDVKVPLGMCIVPWNTTQIEKFTLYVLSIAHPVLLQTTRSEYSYTINTLFGTQDVKRNTFY